MTRPLIEQFKHTYSDMTAMDFGRLDELYGPDVIFKDPVHEIRGLVNLQDYFIDMCSHIDECRFEFLDILDAERSAYIKWMMHFRHPKLAGGKLLTLRGMSHLEFDERITFHEDAYDLGAMVYEWVPVIGLATRFIKKQIAS